MGGYGSGSHHGKPAKYWVEECVEVDLDAWIRAGHLDGEEPKVVCMLWSIEPKWHARLCGQNRDVQAGAGFDLANNRIVFLHDHLQSIEDGRLIQILLSQTELAWGSKRWWFHCPHPSCNYEGYCGKRVRKLYLPPHSRYLGCRTCHDLTYRSRAESRQWNYAAKLCFTDGSVSDEMAQRLIDKSERRKRRDKERLEKRWQRRKRRKQNGWS